MPSSFYISRNGRGIVFAFELLARSYRAVAAQTCKRGDHAFRRADRRAWATTTTRRSICARRPKLLAAPSASVRIGRRSPHSSTRKARFPSTICSHRRRSTRCGAFCWRARSGTTSPISMASSRPISKTVWPARCCCKLPTICAAPFPKFSARIPWSGLGLQRSAATGGRRRSRRRRRRQRQFLGYANGGQPQPRARRPGRLPRTAA